MSHDPRGPRSGAGMLHVLDAPRPGTAPLPSAPLGRLVCVIGAEVGRVFPLGSRSAIIGRAPDGDIVLSGEDVSWHHASVSWQRGGFVVDDLGSTHGILVNGVPVQRHVLAVGDRLQIAESATLVLARHDDLEQRALQFQKLETLGQLAGALAHDFKNMLNVVVATASMLRDVTRAGEIDREALAQGLADIHAAAVAASEQTQRILCFARPELGAGAQPTALAPLVEEASRLVQRTFKKPIEVEIDVAADLVVRGDAAPLHQVLMNLCLNARDAMPTGGHLAIRAVRLELERHEALERQLAHAGGFVELSVIDTGVGMDDLTRTRLFEPFFTTKSPGEGTGLGLFSVFGTVRALGGSIAVETSPASGTTFRLLLPAV